MSFLAILEVLNFDFSKFEQLSSPKRIGSKMIKFQQSHALTLHFDSFRSIVQTIQ